MVGESGMRAAVAERLFVRPAQSRGFLSGDTRRPREKLPWTMFVEVYRARDNQLNRDVAIKVSGGAYLPPYLVQTTHKCLKNGLKSAWLVRSNPKGRALDGGEGRSSFFSAKS